MGQRAEPPSSFRNPRKPSRSVEVGQGCVSVLFRAAEAFMADVRRDLMRPHEFAHERIGFITTRAAAGRDHLVVLAEAYHPVADEDYVHDPRVGARIGQEALRKALNLALLNPVGVLHVHMHMEGTRLWFSHIDLTEQLKYVPDFFKVRRTMPHGALVLSPRSVAGRIWFDGRRISPISEFNISGPQLQIICAARDGSTGFAG